LIEVDESGKNLAFFLVMGGLGLQDGGDSLFEDGHFIEGVAGEEEGEVGCK